MPRYTRRFSHLALSASVAALLSSSAFATDIRWTNASGGTFNVGANWLGGLVPGTSDIADFQVVTSGTGPTYNVNFTSSPTNAGVVIHRDTVTWNLAGNTYTITGTGLAANPFVVAATSTESIVLTISNGTLNTSASSGSFFTSLGQVSGGSGTITLLNTIWTDYAEERIGDGGGGVLNMNSAGTHIVNAPLDLGVGPFSSGFINLNNANAALTVNGSMYVGGSASGAGGLGGVGMSAGNLTVTGTLKLWNLSSTAFNLSGGILSVNTLDTNGNLSHFNWTAGTLKFQNSLTLDSTGPLGNAISLTSGKTLSVPYEEVSQSSNVTITQTGGTHSSTNWIDLGNGSGQTTTYNFSGGNITAPGTGASDSIWGGSGTALFNQTGGTATFGDIALGGIGNGNGTLTLNAPSATFTASIIYVATQGGNGTINVMQGTLTVATLNFLNSNGVINLSGGTLNVGSLNINGDLTRLNWTGGTLNFANAFLIDSGGLFGSSVTLGGTRTLASGGVLTNNGAITLAGGSLGGTGQIVNNNTISGFGTIAGSGGFLNNAQLSLSGLTTLSNTGPNSNPGTINLAPGFQFKLTGGTLSNAGTLNLNTTAIAGSATLNNVAGGIVTGPGTISSPFANAGGLLLVQPGGTTNITGTWSNSGEVQLTSSASNLVGAAITNTGTIDGLGSVGANITNSGSIEPIGGTLRIGGTLTNTSAGTLRTSTGSKLLITSGLAANAGVISLTGGTFDNNNFPLNNTGQITGYGTLAAGGLTNNGSLTFTGGTSTINGDVTNSATKTINIKFNPAIFTGNITNNGTIKTTCTTVTFTGNYTGNTFISDPATNIFQASATTIPGGLMTGSTGDVFIFNTFTNNGTFTNGGNLSVSTSITNTATFSQSGPQSWSTGATFTNSSGTATFASNAKLYGLTVSAGTVDITNSKFVIEPSNKAATLSALQTNIANHALTASGMPSNYGLALVDNALLNKTSFGGNPADANSLLLSEELLGDANIDGHVDLTDLSTILNNFGTTTPAWTSGNFDGQPTIDLTDLSTVLNNFGLSNPNASSSEISNLKSPSPSPTPTPEPTSLAMLTIIPVILWRRRRTVDLS